MSEIPQPITVHDLLRHSDWVRNLARGLLYDKSMTDDVVQEVWAAAIKNPPKSQYAISAWLKKVVRSIAFRSNQAVQRQKDLSTAEAAPEAALSDEEVRSPDELAIRIETQKELLDSVLTLKEPYRTVVNLHYYRDMKLTEIAEMTGVPASTVRTRLSRALEQLRNTLQDKAGSKKKFCALLLPMLPRTELEAMFTAAADQALGISSGSTLASTVQELSSKAQLPNEVASTITLKSASVALVVTLGVVLTSLVMFSSPPSDPRGVNQISNLSLTPSKLELQKEGNSSSVVHSFEEPKDSSVTSTEIQVASPQKSLLNVFDASTQAPLSGVEVFAIRLTQATVIPLGKTNSAGSVELSSSVLKRDALLLFKEGYLLHREAASLREFVDGSFPIHLEPSFEASIEVTFGEGQAAEGVTVQLITPEVKIDQSRSSDASSIVDSHFLQGSSREIITGVDGSAVYSYWHPDTRIQILEGEFVEVSVKAKTPVTSIQLSRGKRLTGRLLSSKGEPIRQSQGEFSTALNSVPRKFSTDAEGRFDLGFVDPQQVLRLTFHHPDWPSYRIESQPDFSGEWEIRMPEGNPLYGKVLAPDGSPVVGGFVFIMEHHLATPKESTSSEGKVVSSVRGVPVPKKGRSQYRLKTIDRAKIAEDGWFQLKPQPDRDEPRYLWVYHPQFVNHLELLPTSLGRGELAIVLDPGTEISGILRGPTGEPMAGALLHLGEIWSHDVESILGRTKTQADGSFKWVGVPRRVKENLLERSWGHGNSTASVGKNERSAIFLAAFAPDELISLDGRALNKSEIWKGFSVTPGQSDLNLVAANKDHGLSLDIRLQTSDGLPVNTLCPAILIDPDGKTHRGQIGKPLGEEIRVGQRFYTDHPLKSFSLGESQLFLMPEGYRWDFYSLEDLKGREFIELTLEKYRNSNQAGLRLQNPLGDPVERRNLFIKIPGVATSLNFSAEEYLFVGTSNSRGEIDLSFLGEGSYEIVAAVSSQEAASSHEAGIFQVPQSESLIEALGSYIQKNSQELNLHDTSPQNEGPEVSERVQSQKSAWEIRTVSSK